MHVLLVTLRIKPEDAESFISLTRENVRETIKEEGVVRFDLIQEVDRPGEFVLFEVYRRPEDHGKHRETAHYKKWSAAVEPMMLEPRARTFYRSVFPHESGWE